MKIDYFSKGGCGCCEVNETSCGCECIRSSTSSPLLSPIPTSVFFKLLNIPLSRACFPFPPPLSLSLSTPLPSPPSPPLLETKHRSSLLLQLCKSDNWKLYRTWLELLIPKLYSVSFLLPTLSLPPPSFSSFLPPPPPPFPNPQSQ